MRKDAIQLEEARLHSIDGEEEFPGFYERHRVFPSIFENRQHKRILDVAAGVGYIAQNIHANYSAELLCNDITPTCLKNLKKLGLTTVSFDLDDPEKPYPFHQGHFDAVIAMAIIEHLLHIDNFLKEVHRILTDKGFLYMMTLNYAALAYLPRFFLAGKTFHDPLSKSPVDRYEFYSHIRCFTYLTLIDLINSFGFVPDTVYLTRPQSSSRYQALSRPRAMVFRYARTLMYNLLPPRWAASPIICFRKDSGRGNGHIRKVLL